MNFDYALAFSIMPTLLSATIITIEVTVAGFGLALGGGLILLILRRSRFRAISRSATFFIEFIRSTPLLIQVFFLYYVGPEYGIILTPLQTGILALGVHYSCYLSEVYRGALENVSATQWDAAIALNFSTFDTYRRVIIPQAIPAAIPAAGNFFIYMFKDSPLLFAIGVAELMHVSVKIGADNFQYLEPVTIVGIIFLGLSLVSALVLRGIESRVGRAWR